VSVILSPKASTALLTAAADLDFICSSVVEAHVPVNPHVDMAATIVSWASRDTLTLLFILLGRGVVN
jgi:hypothetical protein